MADRYLIQAEHDADPLICTKTVEVFLNTGSHYLSGADWGCSDGEHSAWMIVEADNREEARQVVPPSFRSRARVVKLNKFTVQDVERLLRLHGGK